jgi:hypothetical protein
MTDSNIDWLKPENRIRATPLDLFKQGVRTRNWQAIDAAYVMFTGETLPMQEEKDVVKSAPMCYSETVKVPTDTKLDNLHKVNNGEALPLKRKRGRPRKNPPAVAENSVQVIATPTIIPLDKVPETNLPAGVSPAFADCVAPAQAKDGKTKIFTKARSHDCKPRTENKFKDTLSEAAEEIVRDRVVPAELQTHRPPMQLVKVTCSECHNDFMVEPGSVPYGLKLGKYQMKYKCNGCIVGNVHGAVDELDAGYDEPLFDEGE